jgi:hypothetical protein
MRDRSIAEFLFNGNADDTSGNSFHGVVHGATPAPDRLGNPNQRICIVRWRCRIPSPLIRRHRLAVHDEEPMYIGRKGTSEQYFYFNVAIDVIRIYNRALSDAEIKLLWKAF